MIEALQEFAQWIAETVLSVLSWVIDVLLYVPQQLFSLLVDGLIFVLAAIPVPAWVQSVADAAGSLAGDVVWWLDLLQFQTGLAIWASSVALRFLIRRIPVIG